MNKTMALLSMGVACGGEIRHFDTGSPLYPIEDWSCSHNETPFSAHVEASTIDMEAVSYTHLTLPTIYSV